MNPEVLKYIATNRICVFAIEMMDGSPHAATVHYAHHGETPIFIIQTNPQYRKSEPLFGRESSRASLVIGFEEGGNQKTFQTDGIARRISSEEKEFEEAYLTKFPDKAAKYASDIFFIFTPTWWRFSDWSVPGKKTVISSDA